MEFIDPQTDISLSVGWSIDVYMSVGWSATIASFSHDRGQMISHWLSQLFTQNGTVLIGGEVSHMFNASQPG